MNSMAFVWFLFYLFLVNDFFCLFILIFVFWSFDLFVQETKRETMKLVWEESWEAPREAEVEKEYD